MNILQIADRVGLPPRMINDRRGILFLGVVSKISTVYKMFTENS